MQTKVCGMTQVEQVNALNKMGVQYAGFIFYPKSPRYVLNHLTKAEIKYIGGSIKKVGVFVNELLETVLETIVSAGLDMVQLHGDESPAYCWSLSGKTKVIKAFQVKSQADMVEKIGLYNNAVDFFLFDTPSVNYGGTGEKFDWKAIADLTTEKPFLLSGGISPQDIDMIEKFNGLPIAKDLYAIDVNSRFEISPGVKDLKLLEGFLNELNNLNYAE